MNKLDRMKIAIGAIALLSIATITVDSAFPQDNPKPAAPTDQMSGCGCCKKMMEKKMNDNQNKMPGINQPVPSGK